MRVNNDMLCDLAAVIEFDDSSLLPAAPQPEGQQGGQQAAQKGQLRGRFLRYTFVPGLGVGHPAILYDEVGSRGPLVCSCGHLAQLAMAHHSRFTAGASAAPCRAAPCSCFQRATCVDWDPAAALLNS